MLNRAVKRIKGPIILEPQQISALHAIICQVVPKKGLWHDSDPIIKVNYSDDESYTVENPDDVFRLPNRPRKFIRSVRISWPFSTVNAAVELGGSWWRNTGAELEIQADPGLNRLMIADFETAFSKGQDLFLSVLSWPNYVLASVYALLLHACLGWLSVDTLNLLYARGAKFVFFYVLNGWITPVLALDTVFALLKSKFIGNAVFYWEGAINSYKNRKTIMIFFGATVPLAALTSQFFG